MNHLKDLISSIKMIKTIRRNVHIETGRMIDILPSEEKDLLLLQIIEESDNLLAQIQHHLRTQKIDPLIDLALHEQEFPPSLYNKALRIGVYPISANPIHWGHLLVALSAIAHYSLDKVVFVISGDDPRKTHLAPCTWRHQLSKEILEKFYPLFAYSSIAKNQNLDGETNIFRLLSQNPFQKIDAFYIVGTDHYYRVNPKKEDKDTIQKIEENIAQKMYGFNELMHSISIIFAKRRGGSDIPVTTNLNVGFISCLPFDASSTMIREALNHQGNSESIALLPFTVYNHLTAERQGLFTPKQSSSATARVLPPIGL